MIKIAICDDEEKELSRTKAMCAAYLAQKSEYDVKLRRYTDSRDLLQSMESEQYDILLLDIYMPEMTGIELAQLIRSQRDDCQIIFLTTSTDHAIEAFSLHAAHYLVKPYSMEQLEDALNKAISTVDKNKKAQITINIPGGVQRIVFKEFQFSETQRHIQKLYLIDGKCLMIRISSTKLYELLAHDSRFYKCGSTYIINLERIEEITAQSILFESGEKIPMLRRQYKELLNCYTRYSLEGI